MSLKADAIHPPTKAQPKWLTQEKAAAWELFLQVPMPTAHDEAWRRTEIETLDFAKLRDPSEELQQGPQEDMPSWLLDGLQNFGCLTGALGIADSHLWLQPIGKDLAEQGVVFCDLRTACLEHADLLQKYFAPDSPTYASASLGSKFALLNRAMFNFGVFLHVPSNVAVEHPFLACLAVTEPTGFMSLPRTFVVSGANSRAQFVQAFLTKSVTENKRTLSWSLSDALTEIYVGAGAKLDYVELQAFDQSTFACGETHSAIAADGEFSALTVALGGGQVKSDIITRLQGRGATSEITGLVIGDFSERFSFNTVQEHNAPDGRSEIDFRVALKGASSSIYQGDIRVAKSAQRTDAFQSNKNLLLGADARADSIPRLEILTDEVKCSHGATVGPIDREQVFYLMSRGLALKEAEELIVSGFFRQVIEECPIQGVGEWISDLVSAKISGNQG